MVERMDVFLLLSGSDGFDNLVNCVCVRVLLHGANKSVVFFIAARRPIA